MNTSTLDSYNYHCEILAVCVLYLRDHWVIEHADCAAFYNASIHSNLCMVVAITWNYKLLQY